MDPVENILTKMDRLHADARAVGRSAPVGSAPSRTVWRDATGRIVRQGDLRAVTAECSDGRVWDVRGDNPILVTPNVTLHAPTGARSAEGR
jgi:hypothetical protein